MSGRFRRGVEGRIARMDDLANTIRPPACQLSPRIQYGVSRNVHMVVFKMLNTSTGALFRRFCLRTPRQCLSLIIALCALGRADLSAIGAARMDEWIGG